MSRLKFKYRIDQALVVVAVTRADFGAFPVPKKTVAKKVFVE